MTRCVACGTPMIHTKVLCAACVEVYPGILEQARKEIAREDKVRQEEELRQQKIADRRMQLRAI